MLYTVQIENRKWKNCKKTLSFYGVLVMPFYPAFIYYGEIGAIADIENRIKWGQIEKTVPLFSFYSVLVMLFYPAFIYYGEIGAIADIENRIKWGQIEKTVPFLFLLQVLFV